MIKRRISRQIRVGGLTIGRKAPISIQSMVKVPTSDVKAVVSQIKRLEGYGCELVRIAVKDFRDADAVKLIKSKIKIPLAADIHFNYRLALRSIKNGADKIRLNPGNIHRREEIKDVIRAARKACIPIRIGVNSGSLGEGAGISASSINAAISDGPRRKTCKQGPGEEKDLPSRLADSALKYAGIFEELDFHDIIISLKASDVLSTVRAYRRISALCDYPLHLGVTAAGPYDSGIVKSSIGIGALLLDGIGDTIRVSLTADPAEEVMAAKRILGALGLRRFGPEVISCPTCGRCQVDLFNIVQELERALSTVGCQLLTKAKAPVKIAVMGCEVNGPGEAKEADLGVAFGRGIGSLFKKGKIVRKIKAKDAVKEILKEIANW